MNFLRQGPFAVPLALTPAVVVAADVSPPTEVRQEAAPAIPLAAQLLEGLRASRLPVRIDDIRYLPIDLEFDRPIRVDVGQYLEDHPGVAHLDRVYHRRIGVGQDGGRAGRDWNLVADLQRRQLVSSTTIDGEERTSTSVIVDSALRITRGCVSDPSSRLKPGSARCKRLSGDVRSGAEQSNRTLVSACIQILAGEEVLNPRAQLVRECHLSDDGVDGDLQARPIEVAYGALDDAVVFLIGIDHDGIVHRIGSDPHVLEQPLSGQGRRGPERRCRPRSCGSRMHRRTPRSGTWSGLRSRCRWRSCAPFRRCFELPPCVPRSSKSSLDSAVVVPGAVAVISGQTVLIGGLISYNDQNTKSGIPGLADLRYVGDLLGNSDDARTRSEIIIFIRPQVIRNGVDTR
jgi:hypothetical protein